MDSRVSYLLAWCIFLIIVFVVINLIRKRKFIFNCCLVGVLVVFLFGGGSLINVQVFMNERVAQIQAIIDQVGDAYLKTEGNSVFLKVNDEWVNLDDVSIVGEFTQDIVLEYDGEEIPIGHSGIYNTIKVLEDMGLIK